MGMLKEFKEFAMRGNVVDMAVGVIIGGAFGKIVTSIVGDLIMPAVGLLVGGVNFTDLKLVLKAAEMNGDEVVTPAVTLNYGNFIAVFMLVKGINKLTESLQRKKKEEEAKPATPPAPPADIQLLTEIRDLLKKQA